MSLRATARLTIRIHDGDHLEARRYCLDLATRPTMPDHLRPGWMAAAHLVLTAGRRADARREWWAL